MISSINNIYVMTIPVFFRIGICVLWYYYKMMLWCILKNRKTIGRLQQLGSPMAQGNLFLAQANMHYRSFAYSGKRKNKK